MFIDGRPFSNDNSANMEIMCAYHTGYCPHPVTVHHRGDIQSYIALYYKCYEAVTEWVQYPMHIHRGDLSTQRSLGIAGHKAKVWGLRESEPRLYRTAWVVVTELSSSYYIGQTLYYLLYLHIYPFW